MDIRNCNTKECAPNSEFAINYIQVIIMNAYFL